MKILTAQDLRNALAAQFNPAAGALAMICNLTYAAVTRQWVEDKFAPHFRAYLLSRGLLGYRVRGNQCEHFAMQALCEAVNCYRATDLPDGSPESIAACWIAFVQHDGGGHAIIAWLLDGRWEGWEPQTQKWRPLTATELRTVHHPFVV